MNFGEEARLGGNTALRLFAREQLPALRMRLQLARTAGQRLATLG